MKKILFVSFLLMILCCKKVPKYPVKGDEINNCIDSISYYLMQHDSMKFALKWKELINYDTLSIDYLIYCCTNNIYKEDKLFWYDMKTRKGFARFYESKKTKVDQLYLISAIFYQDYFFACDKVLYDTYLAKKMNKNRRYGFKYPINDCDNDSIIVNRALSLILKWRRENTGSIIENYKTRPFMNSDLFWLCEDSVNFNRGDFGWDYLKLKRDHYKPF